MEDKKEKIIQRALNLTSNGNWLIDNEELEKTGISFDDFCDRLDNDYRVCEYELVKDGIDILFWLKYCPNLDEEEED